MNLPGIKMATWCVGAILLWCCTAVSALSVYYLDQHCGHTLWMHQEASRSLSLKLTSAEQYDANMNCHVTFRAAVGSQIMTSMEWVDIRSYRHCPGDFLQVTNGQESGNVSATREKDARICGKRKPEAVMVSEGNYIKVRFVSDGTFFGRGFQLVLTEFHEGHCEDWEYGCDNGRCVHADLSCPNQQEDDLFNHCGDFSNRCLLPVSVIVCLSLGLLVLVVMGMLVAVVVWYRLRHCEGDDCLQCPRHQHLEHRVTGMENETSDVVYPHMPARSEPPAVTSVSGGQQSATPYVLAPSIPLPTVCSLVLGEIKTDP